MKRKIFIICTSLLIAFCAVIFAFIAIEYRATEIPEAQCEIAKGMVTDIREGGIKDAVFRLDNSGTNYYINRGLENNFTLDALQDSLQGKEVTIFYCGRRSILAGDIPTFHIRKMIVENATLYSEY